MVLEASFGQSQNWSFVRGTLGVDTKGLHNLDPIINNMEKFPKRRDVYN